MTPFFKATVGNPPYQLGLGRNSQVYADFYLEYAKCSRILSLIFPSAWQYAPDNTPNGRKYRILKNDWALETVQNYSEDDKETAIFPRVSTGGVNILVRDSKVSYRSRTPVLMEKKRLISPQSLKILFKLEDWRQQNHIAGMDTQVTSSGFGVNTFVTTDPLRKDFGYLYKKNGRVVSFLKDSNQNDVSFIHLWSRVLASNQYAYHFISDTYPSLKRANIDSYKAIWVKMNAPTNWRKTKILLPGEIYSDTFIGIRLDSLEECHNFISYFSTDLYRFCLTEASTNWSAMTKTHRWAPELTHLKNPRTGRMGFHSEWTNQDLKELLGNHLSLNDWAHITKVAQKEQKI
jgi:hypothetical protein